jgi:RNA polymerase sigma factor (TIGR02999 family)
VSKLKRSGEASDSPTIAERRALDLLYSATYEELRRLAASVRRGSSSTLSPTTLVNEAWMKLAGSPQVAATSRLHFKRIAARAMRQILVEAARRKKAHKRGGGEVAWVTFDDSIAGTRSTSEDLLSLEAALEELTQFEPRQAQMVECRFFGGLDVIETAEVLHVSEATVHRDWRAAKAWLASKLRQTN